LTEQRRGGVGSHEIQEALAGFDGSVGGSVEDVLEYFFGEDTRLILAITFHIYALSCSQHRLLHHVLSFVERPQGAITVQVQYLAI
jgi:hypothetical protein